MTHHSTNQRVAVLADAQNLYHSAWGLYDSNVDYRGIRRLAVNGRELTRAIAYVIRADIPDEGGFFDALTRIGFETREKELRRFPDGTDKGNWDVGICLDAISLSGHVDTIVLCTGDGDFTRLVRFLQHEGVRVEVLGFDGSTSSELKEAADEFCDLGSHLEISLLEQPAATD